ncbi:peptidase inhibitor family I36 protein [Streptomyces sp. NPDC021093]|uniref:peptidase inhibitor family I36 protein n=1 Tax=Streptomyces sp. NPDC021093 TaxID=3365112 RepID=UPI00378A2641
MRSSRSPLVRLAVAALFAASGLFAVSPASAREAPADWHCDPWEFCIYTGDHGDGSFISMKSGVWDLWAVNDGKLAHNVRSVKNISGKTWCLYDRVGYELELTRFLDGYTGPIRFEGIGDAVGSVKPC